MTPDHLTAVLLNALHHVPWALMLLVGWIFMLPAVAWLAGRHAKGQER